MRTDGDALTAAVTGGLLPESVLMRVGQLDLHCLLWGAAADPPAVLVHGNGGHAHWWDPLIPALVPGWRLLAPDLRGHGASQWAEPPSYRIEDFSGDLIGVLDTLGRRRKTQGGQSPTSNPQPPPSSLPSPLGVVLVGHSMGGRVAAWFAVHHPERVRGLVLLDTRLGGMNPEIAQRYRGRVAGQRQGRGYASRAEAVAAFRFVPVEKNVPARIVDDLAYHAVVERGPGDWTFRFDRAVLSLAGDGAGDLFPLLGHIRCPVTIMSGERSWVMDAGERAAIAEALPHCTIQTFPGAHHFLVANPEPVGRALRRFLDDIGR